MSSFSEAGNQKVGQQSGNQEFLHVQKLEQLDEAELFDSNAIILDSQIPSILESMLSQIRRMRYKSFYLKPVFLNPGEYPTQLIAKVDGVIEFSEINKVMNHVKMINDRIKQVRSVTSKYTFTESLMVKTLQYLFTRDKELLPIRDRNNKLSYCFPYISGLITQEDQILLLDVLGKCHESGLLEREVIDKVNICKTCSGTYHNFREVCPKCQSLDMHAIDLIHHFRCAYIGPASDFKSENDLICPKCDKELRHIGIDYDKPSQIFECSDCHHQTQNADMKAHCIDCGTENELEYLHTRAIHKYRLTAYGREIAEHGLQKMDTEKIPIMDDKRIVSPETWGVVLHQEIERQKANNGKSRIVKVTVKEDVFLPMDRETQRKVKKELMHEVTGYLRPFDMVTSNTINKILILMPEIKRREVEKYLDVFKYNLQKILSDNVQEQLDLLTLEVIDVDEKVDISEL